MQIAKDCVVGIEYILKGDDGKILDQSANEPLFYLHGHGNLVPGLEQALEGRAQGDKLDVVVTPDLGYGARRPELVFELPKAQVPSDVPHQKGVRVRLRNPQGQAMVATVTKVKLHSVELDGNHALADKTLHFSVTVSEVRKPSKDELAHGHAHAPGHDHH
jgi:FKBP-type peptidyl-prolyl cis-trans isomerase SlyD